MGSVIDNCECPNCGYGEAIIEIYYKTDEEYVWCERCGYSSSIEIANKDKLENEENWRDKVEYKESKIKAIGCFKVSSKKGYGQLIPIKNKKQLKKIKEQVLKNKKRLKEATYTTKRNGEWYIVDMLTGKKVNWKINQMLDEL